MSCATSGFGNTYQSVNMQLNKYRNSSLLACHMIKESRAETHESTIKNKP
jgi:hypothetical protein